VDIVRQRRERRVAVVERTGGRRAPRRAFSGKTRARELMLMAAHDLRGPLTAIKIHADRVNGRWHAGDEPAGAEWSAAIFRICRAADDAFRLIDDLLSFASRQGTESLSDTPPTEVERLLEEAIALHRDELEQSGCKVTLFRDKSLPQRACGPWDRGFLLKVFSNLLRNVVRHAPRAPVRILLARRRRRLRIVFADSGPGFPPKRVEAAVGAAAANETRSANESHGFGLWIVRRAVECLNGRLRIRSSPGRGVAFDIELPGLAL
jgi:signal transduction histidine kinase